MNLQTNGSKIGVAHVKELILISGIPGSGKSTLAKALAERINCNVMSVSETVRKEKLYLEIEKDECGEEVYVVDMDSLQKKVENLEGCWIIEGVVVDFVPPERVRKVLYLQADVNTLISRMKEKGYCKKKICSNLEAELVGSYYYILKDIYGDKVTCVSTNSPLEKSLDQALEALKCKHFPYSLHTEDEWKLFFQECPLQ